MSPLTFIIPEYDYMDANRNVNWQNLRDDVVLSAGPIVTFTVCSRDERQIPVESIMNAFIRHKGQTTGADFEGHNQRTRPPPLNRAQLTDQLLFSPHFCKVKWQQIM